MVAKIYASPGHCIYCGATEVLTDEHIVPLSLNGSQVIDDASCEACRVETCKVENAVTGLMLAGFRAQKDVRTRHGKRRRDLRLRLKVEQDGTTSDVHLVPKAAPHTLALPEIAALPAILDGREARPGTKPEGRIWVSSNIQHWVEQSGYEAATMWHPVDTPMLMRMVAKIAHCFAVAQVGPRMFEPFLVPFILGAEVDFPERYMGGAGGPPTDRTTHRGAFVLGLRHVEREGRNLVVVRVQLFPGLGAPIYVVVVGATKHVSPAGPGKPQYFLVAPLQERDKTGGRSH